MLEAAASPRMASQVLGNIPEEDHEDEHFARQDTNKTELNTVEDGYMSNKFNSLGGKPQELLVNANTLMMKDNRNAINETVDE